MAFGAVTKATTYISGGWDAFNTLITDLLSTSNGKGASQIGIEDSAGNMSAANVEDALAEIYSDTSTTIALAETFDENSATTTSLTWGYKGGLFRLDNVVTTVSVGTIGLTDDSTNYVEINPATGLMTKNTTAFTSGRIPIREVVTVSGSQTTSTDKRAWFSQVAAGTLATAGINNLSTGSSIKTDAYTVTTADTETQVILGVATAADKIFTLPSVGSDEDGMVVHFLNSSDYKLTIQPSDSDSVWNSGEGYGIETAMPGSYCSLRYDNATTSWQPLQIGGGLWMVEGLQLWLPFTTMTIRDIDLSATRGMAEDLADKYVGIVNEGIRVEAVQDSTYPTFFELGTDEFVAVSNPPNLVSSKTVDTILIVRFHVDSLGSTRTIVGQYEDATNRYELQAITANTVRFQMFSGGSTEIDLSGTTVISADTLYTVAFANIQGECGLYLGTGTTLAQEAFDNTWTADTFTGSIYFGQTGGSAEYLDGGLNDGIITFQNLLNAAPVVGLTDTITIPSSFNLVAGRN